MITNQQVKQIADEIYDYISKDSTLDKVFRGDLSNPILPDFSFEKLQETEAYAATIIEKIDHLSKEPLDHYDEVALGVMRFFAQFNFSNGLTIYSTKNYFLSFEITPYSCILPYLNQLGSIPIKDQEAALQYIKLIEQYPGMVRQIADKTKKQAQMEIYLPKEELELVIDLLKGFLIPADQHPLVLNEAKLSAVSEEKEPLIKRSQKPISEAVEIIRELIDFLQSEDYQSKLKWTVGAGQYPGGSEYYQYLANYHTTDEVSAEELHRVGLEQMEVIENRMAEIRKALAYNGTRIEYKEEINKMPELFDKTPEAMGERLNRYLDRIRPFMKDYFQTLCKADCEAVRLPVELEPAMTFGYYQMPSAAQPKGQYLYNALNSEEKNQIGAGSLIYHELLPGHHLQVTLVEENERFHPLFKNLVLTAYAEGWAEYAATLAGEMGMYESLLDEYGRLTMDLVLTTRLVVDTGMNVFGWSREKAAELLKQNSEFSDQMIFTETNRYSNDIPAQALTYKYGSLKMLEIREKAKEALGSRFDIREYHERVLEIGFAPLKVLEMHIDWWIEQKLN